MNDFDDYLRGELRHLRSAVSAAHSEPERIALISRVQERSRTRRFVRAMTIASLVGVLAVAAGTVLVLSSSDRAPDDGPPVVGPGPSRSPSPSDSPSPSESPSLSDPNVGRVVYVFRFREDGDRPHERSDYFPEERRVRAGAGTEARLRTALTELLAIWAPDAELISGVQIVDGRASVEFHDFRKIIPAVSTTHFGTVFWIGLNLTVFQFDGIDQVEYSIEGDCLAFWKLLQAGVCQPPLTREKWDRAGIESEP